MEDLQNGSGRASETHERSEKKEAEEKIKFTDQGKLTPVHGLSQSLILADTVNASQIDLAVLASVSQTKSAAIADAVHEDLAVLASVPQKKEREGGGDRTGNRTTLDQQDGEYIDSSVGQTVMNCGRPAFSLMSAETVDLTDCGNVQSSRDACDITASSVMYLGLALSLNVLARSVSGSYADGVHGRVTQCVRNTGGRGDLACTVEVDRHSLALAHSERNYGGNGAVAAVLSRVNSVRALSEREFADKSERQSDQKSEGKKQCKRRSKQDESSSESESSDGEDSGRRIALRQHVLMMTVSW